MSKSVDASRSYGSMLHVGFSAALAVLLVIVGAQAAEAFHWPFLHGWALAHGTFFILFPAYFVLMFFALGLILPRDNKVDNSSSGTSRPSSLAVISIGLGLVGIVIPLLLSAAALVLGVVAYRQARQGIPPKGCVLAIVGIGLGCLGLAYHAYLIPLLFFATTD